jgi:DNA-directed RNA polymerase beta' subunit
VVEKLLVILLKVLNFRIFHSTHVLLKVLPDTALKMADAGYLTRRLHGVSQDVIVNSMGVVL